MQALRASVGGSIPRHVGRVGCSATLLGCALRLRLRCWSIGLKDVTLEQCNRQVETVPFVEQR